MHPGIVDIFQFSLLSFPRNLSAVHILFVSIFLIKYFLKNLTIASIFILCSRTLYRVIHPWPRPLPPPPLLHCYTSGGSSPGRGVEPLARFPPEAPLPRKFTADNSPLGSMACLTLVFSVYSQSRWRVGDKKILLLWSFAENGFWLCLVPCLYKKRF